MKKEIFAVDLFCGAGGLTHGLMLEGIKVNAGVDVDPACKFPFEENNESKFLEKNITSLKGENLLSYFSDENWKLLAGCAPCQPFSMYTQGQDKSNNDKWGLLYSFANLAEEIRPEVLTMENVPNLAEEKVFEDFVCKLEDLGYTVNYYPSVDCRKYGIPQQRRRLVLFASIFGKIELIPQTHDKADYKTVRETIKHMEKIEAGKTSAKDNLHKSSSLSPINLKRIRSSKQGGTWRDWDESLVTKCHSRKSGKSYPSVYGRMEWDKPSPTMTTQCFGYGNGRFGHPEQDRAISLREAALFQTFPETYAFVSPDKKVSVKTVGKLIGNAVPVELGRVIGKSIKAHLEKINV